MFKMLMKEKIITTNTNKEKTTTLKGIIKKILIITENILMITDKEGKILDILRIHNLLRPLH